MTCRAEVVEGKDQTIRPVQIREWIGCHESGSTDIHHAAFRLAGELCWMCEGVLRTVGACRSCQVTSVTGSSQFICKSNAPFPAAYRNEYLYFMCYSFRTVSVVKAADSVPNTVPKCFNCAYQRRGNVKLWGPRSLPIRHRVENGRPLTEDRNFIIMKKCSAAGRQERCCELEIFGLRLPKLWTLQSPQVLR